MTRDEKILSGKRMETLPVKRLLFSLFDGLKSDDYLIGIEMISDDPGLPDLLRDPSRSIRAISSSRGADFPAGRMRERKYLSLRRRNSILLPDEESEVRITFALKITALFRSSERRMNPSPLVALVL